MALLIPVVGSEKDYPNPAEQDEKHVYNVAGAMFEGVLPQMFQKLIMIEPTEDGLASVRWQ